MSAFRTTVMKLLAVFAAAAAVSATTAIPASASPPDDRADSAGSYLALGDSVAFGYNPLLDPRSGPAQYVGYPDLVARALHLRETNAACPGEATGGFTNRRSDNDNGCDGAHRLANAVSPARALQDRATQLRREVSGQASEHPAGHARHRLERLVPLPEHHR